MDMAGRKAHVTPWVISGTGAFVFLVAAWAEPVSVAVDLAEGLGKGIVARDPGAEDGRCVVADISQMSGTAFDAATPKLEPGMYLAVLKFKLPKINHVNTAPVNWTFDVKGAGRGQRNFDVLLIERAGVYQPIPCPFLVDRPGSANVVLSWKRVPLKMDGRAEVRVEAKDIPTVADVASPKSEVEVQTESEIEAELSEEPPVAGLKYLYMAIDGVEVKPVSDVGIVQLEADKVRYWPGEKAVVQVAVRNYSSRPRTLKVQTVFVQDLDGVIPVDERTLALDSGATAKFGCEGPPFRERWGYAVRCQAFEEDRLVTEKSDCFTVHDNMWAVLIAGRGPAQFTAHVTPERAVEAARWNKKHYRNFVESGFWAPDEYGDFTPDTDRWWSGQGCYYGSVKGTQLQNAEGHKTGVSFAVYSNIWGGDGPPAFEMIRRQPEWGYASTFNVEWLDRWDRNPMGTGSDKFPLHVWPLTIIHHGGGDEPIRYHARELIETHRMCGWDAVRYDSHGIDDYTARLVKIVKETVRKEVPGFQFGYNSSVPGRNPSRTDAFRVHCEGGGGIMEEGIRQFGGGGLSFSGGATYETFAKRILEFKKEAREFGGHFIAIGMDKCFPNDLVYQYIFWFAGNTHPCYSWLDTCVGDYPQFATRFAGQIWDLEVVPVPSPEKWVQLGEAEPFLWLWKEYVHQRDLGNGRRQLIVHLINAPEEKVLYTHDDAKVPPPRQSLPLTVRLPDGAKVRGLWLLTAEYELTQTRMPFETKATGTISFTVPRIRFWSTVVVDLDNARAFE